MSVTLFVFVSASELTAGRVDIRAKLAAHGRSESQLVEDRGKSVHGFLARTLKSAFGDLVYGYKIDVYRHSFGAASQL